MVVYRDKVILPFIFMLVFSNAFAGGEDKYKKQVVSAVREEAQIATLELEEAIGKCDKEAEASSLVVSDFKDIDISHEEITTVMFYFGLKTKSECISEEKFKNFSYSLIKLRSILKYYKDPKFKDIEIDDFSLLSHPSPWFIEELKIKYNKIDLKQRVALEQIFGLSKPFNDFKLLKRIESEIYGVQKAP